MRSDISAGGGVYKSADGEATWRFLGLAATRQISAILVDPHDPNRVYAAALGHAYGPNPERGGKTWQKVLYKNADTGASGHATTQARHDRGVVLKRGGGKEKQA